MKKKRDKKEEEKIQRMPKKLLIYAITFLFVTMLLSIFAYFLLFQHSSTQGFSHKAAIIDQSSITPSTRNETLILELKKILETANFTVDRYNYDEVTVNFYKDFPQRNDYGLIILRTHSGTVNQDVCFFTSEPYSNATYQIYKNYGYNLVKTYLEETEKWYFGIPPDFIKSNMDGKFRSTIFIVAGCDGFKTDEMAKALCDHKGAKAYLGWDGLLIAPFADKATTYLLETLFKNQTIHNAVKMVNDNVGCDPEFKSKLRYYPESAGGYVVPKVASNLLLIVDTMVFVTREKVGFSVYHNVSKQSYEVDLAKCLQRN